MKKSHLVFCLILTLLCQGASAQANRINELARVLVGNWVRAQDGKIFFERWQQVNDSTLKGTAGYQIDGREIITEDIIILQNELGVFYEPLVINQNRGRRVSFQLAGIPEWSADRKMFIFSNPDHDFPKYIRYKRIGDILSAVVSNDYAAQQGQTFDFVKEPNR
ncbi:MAG TPA: hypothetical protein VFV37_03450 [Luteibaculaceae bacterium]|nr:hypothetical protein [Luteibaculaceae bacterium]